MREEEGEGEEGEGEEEEGEEEEGRRVVLLDSTDHRLTMNCAL